MVERLIWFQKCITFLYMKHRPKAYIASEAGTANRLSGGLTGKALLHAFSVQNLSKINWFQIYPNAAKILNSAAKHQKLYHSIPHFCTIVHPPVHFTQKNRYEKFLFCMTFFDICAFFIVGFRFFCTILQSVLHFSAACGILKHILLKYRSLTHENFGYIQDQKNSFFHGSFPAEKDKQNRYHL